METILSVVIPVYNVQAYIKECLESILIDDERVSYFIVNDGSTDDSESIIKKIIKNRANVFYIKQENKGLSCARNTALDYVNSKWVTFIDSDDFVDNYRFRSLVRILCKNKFDSNLLCMPVKNYINSQETILQDGRGYMSVSRYVSNMIVGKYQIGVWSFVFDLSTLRKLNLRFKPKALFEDKFFVPDYLKYVNKIYFISSEDIGFYYYRIRKNSITTSNINEKKVKDWYESGKYMHDALLSLSPRLDKNAILKINENENMILFRTYVDLLKLGDKKNAQKVRNELINYNKNTRMSKSIKTKVKNMLIRFPIKCMNTILSLKNNI